MEETVSSSKNLRLAVLGEKRSRVEWENEDERGPTAPETERKCSEGEDITAEVDKEEIISEHVTGRFGVLLAERLDGSGLSVT